MRVHIRKIGDSQGVLIHKLLLAEAGLKSVVDIAAENSALVLLT